MTKLVVRYDFRAYRRHRYACDLPDQSGHASKKRPWFISGQYCVLGVNNHEDPTLGGVSRAMSIASAPEAEGPVEFYIRRVARPESPNRLTHLLWKLKAGDRLHMGAVATGVFTIDDTIGLDDPRVRIMVAHVDGPGSKRNGRRTVHAYV
jgi:hypothetical protein